MQETIPNMDNFSRSSTSRESGMHMNGLRSYSTVYTNPPPYLDYSKKNNDDDDDDKKIKDARNKKERKSAVVSSSNTWNYNLDPELQRKKRVVAYKAYAVKGDMKGSVKRSFRWIKHTCSQLFRGFW